LLSQLPLSEFLWFFLVPDWEFWRRSFSCALEFYGVEGNRSQVSLRLWSPFPFHLLPKLGDVTLNPVRFHACLAVSPWTVYLEGFALVRPLQSGLHIVVELTGCAICTPVHPSLPHVSCVLLMLTHSLQLDVLQRLPPSPALVVSPSVLPHASPSCSYTLLPVVLLSNIWWPVYVAATGPPSALSCIMKLFFENLLSTQ